LVDPTHAQDASSQQLNHEIVVITSQHELTCMHLHHHTYNSSKTII